MLTNEPYCKVLPKNIYFSTVMIVSQCYLHSWSSCCNHRHQLL